MSEPVKWIVVRIAGDEDHLLCGALDRAGIEYASVSWKDTVMWDDENAFSDRAPYAEWSRVFVWGAVSSVRSLMQKRGRSQGWLHWMNLDQLKCSDYYHAFSRILINSPYLLMPARELHNNWDWVLEAIYGPTWTTDEVDLFVRPNGNNKRFTGHVTNRQEFEVLLKGLEDNLILLVSEPQNIQREWRVLMVEGEPITGSVYAPRDERMEDIPHPDMLYEWYRVAKERWPEMPRMINFDIGYSNGRYGLLEVSSVNSSGFYAMNYDKLVRAITNQAAKEYDEQEDLDHVEPHRVV